MILDIYNESDGIYGATRIAGVLRNRGVVAGAPLVAELMQELNIHSVDNKKMTRRRKATVSKSVNRLIKEFEAYAPNVLWVTDFTELKTEKEEVVYLCVYIDIFPGK